MPGSGPGHSVHKRTLHVLRHILTTKMELLDGQGLSLWWVVRKVLEARHQSLMVLSLSECYWTSLSLSFPL